MPENKSTRFSKLNGKMVFMPMIFICDDEEGILCYLEKLLRKSGYDVETFLWGSDLLERFNEALDVICDAVLLDMRMPDIDGLQILQYLHKGYPDVPIILMTGHGTIDDAVLAIKLGAYDFLTKPFPKEKILEVLGRLGDDDSISKEYNPFLGARPTLQSKKEEN